MFESVKKIVGAFTPTRKTRKYSEPRNMYVRSEGRIS